MGSIINFKDKCINIIKIYGVRIQGNNLQGTFWQMNMVFFSCLPAAKPSGLRTMGLVLLVVVWGGQFV